MFDLCSKEVLERHRSRGRPDGGQELVTYHHQSYTHCLVASTCSFLGDLPGGSQLVARWAGVWLIKTTTRQGLARLCAGVGNAAELHL